MINVNIRYLFLYLIHFSKCLNTCFHVIGHPVTLSCEPSGEGNVSQVEWRIGGCDGRRILVSNTNNPVVVEQDYIDRVSAVTMRGFTLLGTQRNDAGPYCCSLTTFPLGSLKFHLFLYLSEDPQTGTVHLHQLQTRLTYLIIVKPVLLCQLSILNILCFVIKRNSMSLKRTEWPCSMI
uniref:Ig-like domain-containing protein n=1 Tax=Salmo trutta TaxID=8032 RepID=A0A674EJE0_SALTR